MKQFGLLQICLTSTAHMILGRGIWYPQNTNCSFIFLVTQSNSCRIETQFDMFSGANCFFPKNKLLDLWLRLQNFCRHSPLSINGLLSSFLFWLHLVLLQILCISYLFLTVKSVFCMTVTFQYKSTESNNILSMLPCT